MMKPDDDRPRAVPRGLKFPFRAHRTLAETREICQRCGIKLTPREHRNGELCICCRTQPPDAA